MSEAPPAAAAAPTPPAKSLGDTIKLVGAVIGVAAGILSPLGTYKVMQHRVDLLEAKVADLEATVEAAGDEVKCMICDQHEVRCPGC